MLSNDQSFPKYSKKATGSVTSVNKAASAILIKGGANVANKNGQSVGVVETQVSAEDYKFLTDSKMFQRMVKRGFLSTSKPSNMMKDKSAPLTEADIKANNAKAVIITNEKKVN